MKKLFYILFVITVAIACKKDQVPPAIELACTDDVSYSADILPLINLNCSTSGCHDANTAASGYDLSTYASISANASEILAVLNHESGVTAMPFGQPKLADTIIDKFACWKANGALEN